MGNIRNIRIPQKYEKSMRKLPETLTFKIVVIYQRDHSRFNTEARGSTNQRTQKYIVIFEREPSSSCLEEGGSETLITDFKEHWE